MTAIAILALGAFLIICGLMMTAIVIDERGRANRQQARAQELEFILLKITRADFAQPDQAQIDRLRRARRNFAAQELRRLNRQNRKG